MELLNFFHNKPQQILFVFLLAFGLVSIVGRLWRKQNQRFNIICLGAALLVAFVSVYSPWRMNAFSGLLLAAALLITGMAFFMPAFTQVFTFEYTVLMGLSILGGLFAINASNVLGLFLGIELQVLPFYLLMVVQKKLGESFEGVLKYFVLGGISTALFLFGFSLVYADIGSMNFGWLDLNWAADTAAVSIAHSPLRTVGTMMLLSSLCFKASLVPFHMWTPDVYEDTPPHVLVLLATCSKVVAVCAFVMVFGHWGTRLLNWVVPILPWIAIASMLGGALGALCQTNLRRLMAYSTISHMGYVWAVFAGGKPFLPVITEYLQYYVLTTVVLFGCLIHMNKDGLHPNPELKDLSSLKEGGGVMPTVMAGCLFSLAGVPPFPLFWGKLVLVKELFYTHAWTLIGGIVLSSAIGIYYYLNIVRNLFFQSAPASDTVPVNENGTHA